MKDDFHWERDTENYHLYRSQTKDPQTNKYQVVYIPKVLGSSQLPKVLHDMIVSESEQGIQCCYRDNDYDGNCRVHSAPGTISLGLRLWPYFIQTQTIGEANESTTHHTTVAAQHSRMHYSGHHRMRSRNEMESYDDSSSWMSVEYAPDLAAVFPDGSSEEPTNG